MAAPALLFITGASGTGKTTAVRALEAQALPGVRCFYFDAVGVPSAAEMIRDYGSGEAWQAATTAQWVRRLVVEPADVAVLDGQARPSVIRAALQSVGETPAQIVLLDCSSDERVRRLAGPRSQPELASPQMSAWAAYLRGQADALELPVIDTTRQSIEAVTDALVGEVERLRAIRNRAGIGAPVGALTLGGSMKRVTGIGGIFFKAKDAPALQAWYARHLGIDVQSWGGTAFTWTDGEGNPTAGTTVWSIGPAEGDQFAPSTATFMVNYRVDDLHALVEVLREEGCNVLEKIDESEYGKFAWVIDPEGNKVELWQPPAGQ